ncbi:Zinc finger MYM-type protein 1 [Acropora cervicornis]|uniref:Zinc finger MYM-type protein 1 n=1 Tax=Acropora cervicornis TaxID=6130 RepID=A0AAD9UUV0_ACRCE|nr:Zinc finger MYM-type protein 1 [Acropora cervicornis]
MNFKLLFIFSLALGTVLLDAIRLVEHGNDEISLLDKLEWAFAGRTLFTRAVYRLKYLKRRIRYSYGHPGSFNPAVITNKEAHMIYGNMDKETGTSQATGSAKKKRSKISDFFSKMEQCCIEEPACKRSCQPIGNTALTDMQTTKSTAEQPRSPTVHIQQLEAEYSASPGQSLTDNLHITEPFQPTNFNFPKKTFGKQNRSFQSKWFNDFPWLRYNEQSDSVLCFICAQQNEKLNLRAARNKEWVFISQGFSNWKKALVRFKEHQVSECHKLAMEYQISIPNTCGNVIQMSNDAAKKTMATNRFCLLKIIECLQYLARQAMPMQGDTDEESNFIQLLKLRGKDQPVLLKWLERKDDKIQDVQPKAHPTHCHGHSLSLSVKDTVKNCKLLLNTMDTAKEIVALIKFSPKRERLLGDIKENLDEEHAAGCIITLCPTRWTVRASCFQRIIDNYSALLQEWIVCLDQKLQADVRGTVIGVEAQMNTFDFFFGLNLGERLCSHTDNLSKSLQKTKMSAVSGQRVANVAKQVLEKMRNNECFKSFYDTVLVKSKQHPSVSEPALPRQRRAPSRFEIGTGAPSYPTTPQDHYRRVYFEAIDLMDYSTELRYLETNYKDDVNVGTLNAQLEIFKLLMKEGEFTCLDDIQAKMKTFSEAEKSMISEIITICNLLLVNPATSAAGERSFSSARRLKTWLRSTMTQTRFSNLAILNTHKQRTDNLCLIDIANEFTALNDNRRKNFGTFKESDFKISG